MDSTVFAVAVIGCVVGAIFGVLVKHILDNRNYTEVCNWYLDEARKVDERDKVISDLQDEINRLHEALAVKSLKEVNEHMKKVTNEMCNVEFFDVNDLPEHFNDDIDFGGKF